MESNSNSVLNGHLVNQKPGWGDTGEEGMDQPWVRQNAGPGTQGSWLGVILGVPGHIS